MGHKYFEDFNFKDNENIKQEDDIAIRDKSRVRFQQVSPSKSAIYGKFLLADLNEIELSDLFYLKIGQTIILNNKCHSLPVHFDIFFKDI